MTRSRDSIPVYLTAAILIVLSAVCVIGAGFRVGGCQDSMASETEKAEQRPEVDDVDDLNAIVLHAVVLHASDMLCERLHIHHDCPLFTSGCRWHSRGPPTA
ncbi:MAG: hypothetical protein R3C59_04295 [Planctomycetaceae bacterium]